MVQVGEVDNIKGFDSIKRIYSPNGKAPTLTTMQGGHREPKVAINVERKGIENPEYVVREKGRQKVLEEGRKNVHAFVRGTLSDIDIFNQECLSMPKEVTYNPYKYDSFVDGSTYQPVKKSKWARLIKKGNDKPRILSYE